MSDKLIGGRKEKLKNDSFMILVLLGWRARWASQSSPSLIYSLQSPGSWVPLLIPFWGVFVCADPICYPDLIRAVYWLWSKKPPPAPSSRWEKDRKRKMLYWLKIMFECKIPVLPAWALGVHHFQRLCMGFNSWKSASSLAGCAETSDDLRLIPGSGFCITVLWYSLLHHHSLKWALCDAVTGWLKPGSKRPRIHRRESCPSCWEPT